MVDIRADDPRLKEKDREDKTGLIIGFTLATIVFLGFIFIMWKMYTGKPYQPPSTTMEDWIGEQAKYITPTTFSNITGRSINPRGLPAF